ncbi:MAG: hypothetical protein ACREDR_47765 [Blastocatellia bacterium]
MDMRKAIDELPILRDFIDFVNRQVGVYCDCLSGFQGNKVRIERQVARVNRPVSQRMENGQPVIMWVGVEDPTRPDVIHHRIIRADEFIDVNSEARFNEQQVCWGIIVFLFAYWDEKIRPRIAKVRGVKSNDVRVDTLGDLRILRKSIVHNAGVIATAEHAKLKVLSSVCEPDTKLYLTHDKMHKVFVEVKKAIGDIILQYTGGLPGAPNPGEIVEVAIQNVPR